MTGSAVIAGIAESDEVGRVPDSTVLQLAAQAANTALSDAGLGHEDIDGLFIQGSGFRERFDFPQETFGEYLGIEPSVASSNDMGGASAFGHLQYAILAIEAGLIETALVAYGSTNYSDQRSGAMSYPTRQAHLTHQYEAPYGLPFPVGAYGLIAKRYLYEYDLERSDLAEIAVATREWAKRNPRAMMRDDLTIQEVMDSPPVCEPLHKYDCCLISDAGGAVVLTSTDTPRDGKGESIHVTGLAQRQTHDVISQMPSLMATGARETARRAYRQAGATADEVDVAQVYDSFTITAALLTEAMGFADPGRGPALFASGETGLGGSIPINTHGGGLSCLHPGTYGIFLLIEAVRQLRGLAGQRQVSDATTALAHATGGLLGMHATAILEVER